MLAAVVLVVGVAGPARADVLVDARFGFPALPTGTAVRAGQWVAIVVDVSLSGERIFDGTLRVAQFDNDGDVCVDQVEVHLSADTGGTQRHYLYIPASPLRGRSSYELELLDVDGAIVEVVASGEKTRKVKPLELPRVLSDDDLYILSVSTGPMGRVSELYSDYQNKIFSRPIVVGHVAPAGLPELWIGLETVDHVIWEDARADDMTAKQLEALIEWVRQGGTLLITASRFAPELAQLEALDDILPVDLGDVLEVENLPEAKTRLLGVKGVPAAYTKPITVIRCTARQDASVLHHEADIESDLITRRALQRGQVLFCGVTLKELMPEGSGSPLHFFKRVLLVKEEGESIDAPPQTFSLHSRLAGQIGFGTSGGLYLLAAFVFSIAYVAAATFGVWSFLSARGWKHLNWTVFGLVTCVACVLSVVAVAGIQGIGTKVHQFSIVDLDAGDRYAHATVLFGVKTSSDTRLDIWLPFDADAQVEPGPTRCFLRPIGESGEFSDTLTSFADPTEYRLSPSTAVIDDLRIRATLKRLEGRWEGPIHGTLTGQLRAVKRSGIFNDVRFTPDSYIINNLGVDLENCYLLHAARDVYDSKTGALTEDRSDSVFAYYIGKIPAGQSKVRIAPICYKLGPKDKTVLDAMNAQNLDKQQEAWTKPLRSLIGQFTGAGGGRPSLTEVRNAVLLLSTAGEWDPGQQKQGGWAMSTYVAWQRDRMRQLDLRQTLRRDTAVLIGFAGNDAGPVRLAARTGNRKFRTLTPDAENCETVYRIRIPVAFADRSRSRQADTGTKTDANDGNTTETEDG